MTKMSDVTNIVLGRIDSAIGGQKFDMLYDDVTLPKMLGITPIHQPHNESDEEGTLLDPDHPLWDESVLDRADTVQKLNTAIRILKERGDLCIYEPLGEAADIIYVETNTPTSTECCACGSPYTLTDEWTEPAGNNYTKVLSVDCIECGHSGEYETVLTRR